ncbi:MAG: SAM-dependent methyltransferase [Geobacteraceae bacterium GWC2_58_44]|nr:MAG: SAM-dependent methyltransferase [Geobacteraceae bacterium GWC2_58_44]HBG05767.1 SAM-dependent methyltransferase [Geobacter sp.]
MEADRIKWDERYGGKDHLFSLAPSRLLAEKLELIRSLVTGRRALDIACGEGRNGIFLAQNGFEVDAVDVSGRGLARGRNRAAQLGLQVNFVRADLEQYRLQGIYHLIVDFNFLLRPLIPALVEALAPGGVILMETILNAPTLQGVHTGEFLLQPGELERLFAGFQGRVLLLEEDPSGETPVARILFQKAG